MNIGSLFQEMGAKLNGMTRQVPESHNPHNRDLVNAVKEHLGPEYASNISGVNTKRITTFAKELSLANGQVNQAIADETSVMRQKCLKVAGGALLTIATLYLGWNNLGSLSALNPLSYF